MRKNKLSPELGNRYIYFFILPLIVVFLCLFFLNPKKSVLILMFGFLFVLGDLFFIKKAMFGKKAWVYTDVVFLFFCLIIFMTHFKSVSGV